MMASKPHIILDWGWLQSRPFPVKLNDGYTWIFPDVALRELSYKKDDKVEGYVKKLLDTIELNRNVLKYGGAYWFDLEKKQKSPKWNIGPRDIINTRSTNWFCSLCSMDLGRFIEDRNGLLAEYDDPYERHRTIYGEYAAIWSDAMKKHDHSRANRLAGSSDMQDFLVTNPGSILPILKQLNYSKYTSKKWHGAVKRREWTPAAHFCQAIVYFTMRSLAGSRDSNDWDDAQYAMLSCYTGYLATKDRSLKRLAALMNPSVVIIDD